MRDKRDILLEDTAYAFGDLLEKTWQPLDELLGISPKLENTLLTVRKGDCRPLSGAYDVNFEWKTPEIIEKKDMPQQPSWIPIQSRSVDIINELLRIAPTDCFFYVSMNDARFFRWSSILRSPHDLPVFQHHRRKGRSAIIHPLKGYHDHPSALVPTIVDRIPFREKASKIVWRGGLRGYFYEGTNYKHVDAIIRNHSGNDSELDRELRQISRYRLSLANESTDILDIAYVIGKSQMHLSNYPLIASHAGQPMAPDEQISYRYILALNGNDWPSNIYWAINSNSVVFVEESDWEIYGGNHLRAWEHFIPIAPNENDLRKKFEWCESHIDECIEISANAREAWRIIFDPWLQAQRATAIRQLYVSEWLRRFGN